MRFKVAKRAHTVSSILLLGLAWRASYSLLLRGRLTVRPSGTIQGLHAIAGGSRDVGSPLFALLLRFLVSWRFVLVLSLVVASFEALTFTTFAWLAYLRKRRTASSNLIGIKGICKQSLVLGCNLTLPGRLRTAGLL